MRPEHIGKLQLYYTYIIWFRVHVYIYSWIHTDSCIYLFVCLSVCLSIYLSIYLSVYLSIDTNACAYLHAYLDACMDEYIYTFSYIPDTDVQSYFLSTNMHRYIHYIHTHNFSSSRFPCFSKSENIEILKFQRSRNPENLIMYFIKADTSPTFTRNRKIFQ